MPQFSPYFIAGIGFFLIYKFGSNYLLWAIVGFNWIVSLGNVRKEAIDHMTPAAIAPDSSVLVTFLTACFVLMALVSRHKLDKVRWRWLVVAGALTYPLYLMHQVIGFIVNDKLHGLMPAPLVALTAFTSVVAFSWLTWRLVEVPLGRRIKAGLKHSFVALDAPDALDAEAPVERRPDTTDDLDFAAVPGRSWPKSEQTGMVIDRGA